MTDDTSAKDEILASWAAELADALALGATPVDVNAVLDLAGVAAHAVLRPAAPLTTYLVGYAVGRAAGGGASTEAEFVRAVRLATEAAEAHAAQTQTAQTEAAQSQTTQTQTTQTQTTQTQTTQDGK